MDARKKLLKIGELAGRTGRSVRALRLYEERGLLSPAERTESGYRMYEESQTERIEYIDRLQKAGLTLTQIGELVEEWRAHTLPPEAMDQVRTVYRARLEAVREQLAELQHLEVELVESLQYLNRCCGCEHTGQTAEGTCGPCVHAARVEEEIPTLISGLTLN